MNREFYLPVSIANVEFKNPFYVASGPTTRTVGQLVAIEKAGWAAASIKLSIDPAPYINRYPRYGVFSNRKALGFTAEKRLNFQEGLRLIEEAKKVLNDLILMANITYSGDIGVAGWVNMAKEFEVAGADIIELNMCCPNMSFNIQTTSGDKNAISESTGASMGKEKDAVREIVSAIKKEVSIPLFVKLTPEGGEIGKVAKAAYTAGADAVGGTGNRLGIPPINLESPGKAFYHLQDEISMTCYCGEWLKPLSQRDTYEMRKACGPDMPIMATGGIRTSEDALEMAMCGADLLGICTETLMSGYGFIGEVIINTKKWLKSHNYQSLKEVRDGIVPHMKSALDLTLYKGYARVAGPTLISPCKSVCPFDIDIQAVLRSVSQNKIEGARLFMSGSEHCETCAGNCEKACVKGRMGEGISIKNLMIELNRQLSLTEEVPFKQEIDKDIDDITVKAKDVLYARNHKYQPRVKITQDINSCVDEASRCLRCACGEGCRKCVDICTEFAIQLDDKNRVVIDAEKCSACGMCFNLCPNKNIEIINTNEVL